MMAPSNQELDILMQAASTGDEQAFRKFYDLSAPSILAFLLRLLRDRFHAEDVLQEAMVIAWNKAYEFDASKASAKTWITTIARRRALDLIRSQNRRSEILNDEAPDIRMVLGIETVGETPVTESSATGARLASCFGEISTDAASCIQFAYLDGLTFSEIAARVERSIGTVKSWVQRGLVKLQECMQR